MDGSEYTTLAAVADPRKRRGQRYRWEVLLLLVAAAILSGERHGRGIGQWVREHADELRERLGLTRLPSKATLRRALRAVAVEELERHLRGWVGHHLETGDEALVGVAVDGKELRGAGHHGPPVVLVSLVRHDGFVLDQVAAPRKLLTRHALQGWVVTADALLAERSLDAAIRAHGGHYLFVIKGNQPLTEQAIAALLRSRPWTVQERAQEYQRQRMVDYGHGRRERRTLEASGSLNTWLDWPEVGQVLKRTTRRVIPATGEVQEAVTYALINLTPAEAGLAELERLWRGHWHIENQVHYVRDVSMGEDAGQAYRGQTPQALAAVRNAVLNLLRLQSWRRIPDALRHYAAHLNEALTLIGAAP